MLAVVCRGWWEGTRLGPEASLAVLLAPALPGTQPGAVASREGAPCSFCLSLQPQGARGVSVIFSRQCFFLRESQKEGEGAARARFVQARASREGSIPGLQPKGGSLRGYPTSGEMGFGEEGKWWRLFIPSVF